MSNQPPPTVGPAEPTLAPAAVSLAPVSALHPAAVLLADIDAAWAEADRVRRAARRRPLQRQASAGQRPRST
ncbi:hypothetical protein [Longispora urticae]